MNNYLFVNTEFFFLLVIPFALLIWYVFKNKKNTSEIIFSNLDSLKQTKTIKNQLRHVPHIFKILAILLLIIALARPQSSTNWEESTTEGIDIILSMDKGADPDANVDWEECARRRQNQHLWEDHS